MKLNLSILALGAAILLAVADTAFSQTTLIDVDIGIGALQTGGAVLGSAGDVWNGFTANTATVINSAGATLSGVGITMSGQAGVNANDTGGTAMDAATTPLMQDYAYLTAAGTITVSLTGLTAYNGYPFTLVVYAAGDNASPSQGASLAVTAGATGGNTASTLTTSGNPDRKLSDGPGVAYQTFTGTLTNGTLTFTATRLAGSTYLGLNGFQLQMFLLPPVITSQPVSQTTFISGTASFSVGAAGATPLSYQWQANGGTGFTNLINGGQISGVNTNVLTISGATTNWALTYQVVVTNSYGAITSSPATLTLVSYPLFVTNSISIQNYSFENPVVTDGNFTTTLPGWSTSGNAGAFCHHQSGHGQLALGLAARHGWGQRRPDFHDRWRSIRHFLSGHRHQICCRRHLPVDGGDWLAVQPDLRHEQRGGVLQFGTDGHRLECPHTGETQRGCVHESHADLYGDGQ